MAHYAMGAGVMGNGAIVYRGYGVQGVWAMGPMDSGGTGVWAMGYRGMGPMPHCPCAPLAM